MISAIGSTPTAVVDTGSTNASGLANGDFQTFLKMLTTQITNQDPLNPMEGSDFAVQLATFSGVEQQARTNQLLQSMLAGQGQSDLGQVAGWIGKEVRVAGQAYFSGKPLTLQIEPHGLADDVVLIVSDRYGRELTQQSIGPGKGQIDWTGPDGADGTLPSGVYSFRIQSLRGGDVISEGDVETYARVVETEIGSNGVILGLEGGVTARLSEVTAIRAPQS